MTQVGRTVRTARAVLEVLSPLTGARASGQVLVKAAGADAPLPCGSFFCPVIPSTATPALKTIRRDLLYRTTQDAVVSAAGVLVPVVSVMGGARHNLAAGVEARWDPQVPGVELVSATSGAVAGAAEPTGDRAVRHAVIFEGVGGPNAARDLFKGLAQSLTPAVVLAWMSTQRGDVTGRNRYVRTDTWTLYVAVDRGDGSVERFGNGLDLLDAAEELLQGRASVGGYVFSAPAHAEVTARNRSSVTPSSYVYSLTLQTQHLVERLEVRGEASPPGEAVWREWDSAELASGPGSPMFPVVDGVLVRIPQGGFDDGFDDGFN